MTLFRIMICFSLLFGSIVILSPSPLDAHHGSAAFFHLDKTIEVRGVVKSWRFANPHPFLVVEVADESGKTADWRWEFAPSTATTLAKRGWSGETFRQGEVVTANRHPSKVPGVNALEVRTIARADGSVVR
jgi:hypothetical protein